MINLVRLFFSFLPVKGRQSLLRREVFVVGVSLLLTTVPACTSHSKSKAQARAAFVAGQRQATARMAEKLNPTIQINGRVRNPTILWTEDLTLAKAIVAAEYYAPTDPISITILRQDQQIRVVPRKLLAGEDVPLQPGDVIELR